MIYIFISEFDCQNKSNIQDNKRDCRIIRQPLRHFTDSVAEYIENTKNESVKKERKLAYSTLFCSLKAFFSLDAPELLRTENGKPYLKDSNISISLSHSDGAVAVCISDEGEVGVDLQSEIDSERQKRLEGRFFTDFDAQSEKLSAEYYLCTFCDNEVIFESINPDVSDTDSFSAKWSAAESLMKLSGGGFGDITSLLRLAEESKTDVRKIDLNRKYYLAISVKES